VGIKRGGNFFFHLVNYFQKPVDGWDTLRAWDFRGRDFTRSNFPNLISSKKLAFRRKGGRGIKIYQGD